MKTALLTLALAATTLAAAAQSKNPVLASAATPVATAAASAAPASAYTTTMAATIDEQNNAGPLALPANAAKLERVAAAAPTAWEPRYYQARAYLKMGFTAPDDDQKDANFDRAQTALDQARKLPGADQAELLILQAYIYQGRIMVSPMSRGMVYTGRVAEALNQVKKLAPDNPRLYLLLGNDSYYRPAMFGGGPDKAKPMYEKAKALFAAYQPANTLSPNWGEKMNEAMLARAIADLADAK